MPAHSVGFWADIATAINGAWPERTGWFKWHSFAARKDWEQDVRDGKLHFPFIVVKPEPANRPQKVPMTSIWYGTEVRLVYVMDENTASVETELDDRMDTMEAWLLANYREQFTTLQVRPGFRRDIGLNSEAAQDLRNQKLPESAAEFTFEVIWPGTNVG